MTTPLIIVKMLVSGKLFLSLPSRGGDSSRDEGVIKEGAVKAQLSCWRWTISTTHTSVCSCINRAVWEGSAVVNLERRERCSFLKGKLTHDRIMAYLYGE